MRLAQLKAFTLGFVSLPEGETEHKEELICRVNGLFYRNNLSGFTN